MATPFFFVKKKEGKLQPCQDYRYLNEWMIKNAYPLPLISELMDKIKDGKYFTKLDIQWVYNKVWIKEGDEWKVAFKANWGLYEPMVMFFRMCNSPATCHAMMDDIFNQGRDHNNLHGQHVFISQNKRTTLRKHQTGLTMINGEWFIFEAQKSVSFAKRRSNGWEWSYRRGRSPWTPESWKEFRTGQPLPWSSKCEGPWDLETFIDASFKDSLKSPNL